MTDYERIQSSCLKRGELWEDPDFPATQSSVFYHQTPPFQFAWKRPKELCENPVFVYDSSPQFDVTTGKMDRWFVSCLGVLYLSKGLFYRVVPADQGFGDKHAGVFRFRLWWCGEWVEVLVDDRLPTVSGKLAFLHPAHSDQFWPGLLEKAYAKLHGSYEALKYGTLLDGLADLTGGITESIAIRQDSTASGRLLSKLLEMTSIITCIVHNSTQTVRAQVEKLANGIQIGCNYRLYAIEKVETFNGEIVQLVKLRNPIGPGSECVGSWSNDSSEWDDLSQEERDRLDIKNMEDGEFWISYSDFIKTFTHLEVVHLDKETSRDEPSLQSKNTWQMKIHQGAWRKGVSAGGCRNNPDTFHMNPQIQVILQETEELVISLNQHSIMEPKVIGFSAYALPKNCVETIQKPFFKKKKSLMNSQYTNSRQVSHRCLFDQGDFVILPTTFEPADESGFTLRVFSTKPLKFKFLDISPMFLKSAVIKAPAQVDAKSFVQYEAVFLQLADEHKTVNAFELQELLDACLPNDYIKSCASMEVCRQVVLALDRTGSGRLKFVDFKDLMCSLKHWQTAFKNHTKEKTGVLKAERLRDAILELGYQISNDVLSTLILKYMRKDGTLRFGDFVSAILHLHVAFALFESKDPLQNGTIKLSLSDWLKSALMC
ncbi:calpain C isoform X2 [Arctopsyche grandis]|uniref:calpain C isoform X2 n=1 Tax=Arctopsyche grandis TaxID=121162 RepID=UPI00406D8B44